MNLTNGGPLAGGSNSGVVSQVVSYDHFILIYSPIIIKFWNKNVIENSMTL